MYDADADNLEDFLNEDNVQHHLTTLNKSALQHHRVSFQNSNFASHIMANHIWENNAGLMNEESMKIILNSADNLLKGSSLNNIKNWRSSLDTLPDPQTLFDQSVSPCHQCSETADVANLNYLKHDCKCDLGITEPQKKFVSDTRPVFVKSLGCDDLSQESRCEEERRSFKPRFNRHKPMKPVTKKFGIAQEMEIEIIDDDKPRYGHHKNTNVRNQNEGQTCRVQEVDLVKEEEENNAHKSSVAKITFKTAKEQLLASNPAAKRTLGASRKAQGKFVSPMLGASEKQESAEPTCSDERLRHIDPKMIELIESEIIDKGTPIGWEDIAGLESAKAVLQEAVVWPLVRPDLFTGLRRPPRGVLLFGPPGTGKTLIGKCVAAQCRATFFSISASSLTSKWIGDGEKMVRALFAVATCHQPAVIFIDEIDSLLSARSDTEHEATRRIKTEFLVHFDGAATDEEERLLVIGATNRPQELDEAARRRLVKRLYIPLPDQQAREQIILNLLKCENNELSAGEVREVAALTAGYSGADMKSLCCEAAMGPVRALPLTQIATIDKSSVRPVNISDFRAALQRVRPSVSQDDLGQYVKWNNTYGQGF